MTLTKPAAVIDTALATLTDNTLTIEDRAAAYGFLHQVQLRINRRLRSVKDEIIVFMESNRLKALGPLTVKATAIDVKWPANDPGNWGDAGLQDEMEGMSRIAPDYFRHVPAHVEIDTLKLGEGVTMGDPVARQLHNHCKDRGWRTEEGRRLSLAVTEVKEA